MLTLVNYKSKCAFICAWVRLTACFARTAWNGRGCGCEAAWPTGQEIACPLRHTTHLRAIRVAPDLAPGQLYYFSSCKGTGAGSFSAS